MSANQISKSNSLSSKDHMEITQAYSPKNYAPLEVVVARGEGAWVTDVEGKRYLDMLSAYSAVNFGHCNKRIAAVAKEQIDKLTLTSRAFYNDQIGLASKDVAEFCGMESVLFMNSGAEAVETSVKLARRWAYDVKGVEEGKAEIITCSGNFHGRTTTIISFADSASSRKGFGPFTPGFHVVQYGDIEAIEKAINKNTAAILFEPIQGEGGVIIPPSGFIKRIREICTKNNVLMIADEIQTGLCRTGARFCCDHEGVVPDAYIVGKSLGGGITPISAVISTHKIMSVFTPGSHGSTFGGNPFACAIAREVIKIIKEEGIVEKVVAMGEYFGKGLRSIKSSKVTAIRGKGLMFGVDIDSSYGPAKKLCNSLLAEGVLCKDTREQTIRFAPPLIIQKSDIDWGLERIEKTLTH